MPHSKYTMRVLAADVGGTNARLELWEAETAEVRPDQLRAGFARTYASRDFGSLRELVVRFLRDAGLLDQRGAVDAACIAVCGPVEGERRMAGPVLPEQPPTQWGACADDVVGDVLHGVVLSACLINDFVAVGFGVPWLPPADVVPLHSPGGDPAGGGVISVIGAGTGLGQCFLTPGGPGGYMAHPSEGGMAEFHPRTALEGQLRQFLIARDGYCCVESVVSGPGLANVFTFLSGRGDAPHEGMGTPRAELPKYVLDRALAGDDPLCGEAVGMVVQAWAAECRGIALRTMCAGGLFLGGGLAPKLLPFLKRELADAYAHGDPLMGEVPPPAPGGAAPAG